MPHQRDSSSFFFYPRFGSSGKILKATLFKILQMNLIEKGGIKESYFYLITYGWIDVRWVTASVQKVHFR